MIILFIVYQLIQLILLPAIPLYLIWRTVRGKPCFGNFYERIGLIPNASSATYWFHAVSVGEVLSLQTLLSEFKKSNPHAVCYLTVGTLTGKKIAQEKISADHVSFLPYDFLPSMLLAYTRIKPKKIIIVEAEIWPNLLMLAHYKKIPLYLLNARINPGSQTKYRFLSKFFNLFTAIFAQSKTDTERFAKLGVTNVSTMGNIKAYNALKKLETTPSLPAKNNTLLIGSVHPGELDIYLNLFSILKQEFPTLTLILAPRHFHWKQELIRKVKQTTHSFFVWDENHPYNKEPYAILLVCKLGELFSLYKQATIYFLGGTFVPVGGHNLLEPAVWGNAIIIGPYNRTCKTIADQLEEQKGLIRIKNKATLVNTVRHLLSQPSRIDSLGNHARAWVEQEAKLVQHHTHEFIKILNS